MTSKNTPIILLVPGAFGTPSGFESLLPYLEESGFTTHTGSYPSCNPTDPSTATCMNDITSLRNSVLLPLLTTEPKDIVIIAHSYGGVVAGAAAKDLDKDSRAAQGQAGGIIGLIYVAGNITLEGETLLHAVGGAYPPFIKVDKPSPGLAIIESAMEVLYNDCDPTLAPELGKFMHPHALLAFESKPGAPAWADKAFDGKRAYIRTLNDCCNPLSLQSMWLEKSGVDWNVVDFESGHMPFVSQPESLAKDVVSCIRGFLKRSNPQDRV